MSNSSSFQQILNSGPVSRIRRNHGLEHATLNILAEKFPRSNMAGHSDAAGFWLVGDVPTEAVTDAVDEALRRMKSGESELAIHPNCGTNFVAAGAVAGVVGWLGMLGSGRKSSDKFERLPIIISMTTIALVLAQPLGLLMQAQVTTSGQPGDLRVVSITPSMRGKVRAHRVLTQG